MSLSHFNALYLYLHWQCDIYGILAVRCGTVCLVAVFQWVLQSVTHRNQMAFVPPYILCQGVSVFSLHRCSLEYEGFPCCRPPYQSVSVVWRENGKIGYYFRLIVKHHKQQSSSSPCAVIILEKIAVGMKDLKS